MDNETQIFNHVIRRMIHLFFVVYKETEQKLTDTLKDDRHMARTILVNALGYVLARTISEYAASGGVSDTEELMNKLYPKLQEFLGNFVSENIDSSAKFIKLELGPNPPSESESDPDPEPKPNPWL